MPPTPPLPPPNPGCGYPHHRGCFNRAPARLPLPPAKPPPSPGCGCPYRRRCLLQTPAAATPITGTASTEPRPGCPYRRGYLLRARAQTTATRGSIGAFLRQARGDRARMLHNPPLGFSSNQMPAIMNATRVLPTRYSSAI